MKLEQRCNWLAAAVAVVTFLALCAMSTRSMSASADCFSDMHTLMSGENFAKHGFFRMKFLPLHYVGGVSDSPRYYLHCPPLANIINGVLQSAGVRSLSAMRVFSALVLVVGVFIMYRALAKVIGPLPSVCGMLVFCTSAYVVAYGMSLYEHCYNVLLVSLFLWLFLEAIGREKASMKLWAACWAVLVVSSFNSFEFIPYAQVFAWVYVIAGGEFRRRWKVLLLLASAPLFGVGLHFMQNVWAVGWQVAWADRLGFGHFGTESRWDQYSRLPGVLQTNTTALYYWPWQLVPLFALAGLLGAYFLRGAESLQRAFRLCVAAMAAGITWYVFLPGHTLPHSHTVNQLFPLYFMVLGGAVALAAYLVVGKGQPVAIRIPAGIALAVVLFGQISGLRAQAADRNEHPVVLILRALGPHALPSDVGIAFNSDMAAQYPYYLRRPAWPCPSLEDGFPKDVGRLKQFLPADFKVAYLFIGPMNQAEVPIMNYLCERCPGIALRSAVLPPSIRIILFDATPLCQPGFETRLLPEEMRKQQLNGEMPPWDVPGFDERVSSLFAEAQENRCAR